MLIYIEMCQLCVIWAESLDSVTVSESVYVQLSIQCHLSRGDTNIRTSQSVLSAQASALHNGQVFHDHQF